MSGKMVLLPTKLVAPKPRKDWLARPKLGALLCQLKNYPVTLVTAGPGYGKSTAVVLALAELALPHAWYSVGEDDGSGYVFCHYLAEVVEQLVPGAGANAVDILAAADRNRPWLAALDALLKALAESPAREGVLVVDDFHLVADSPEVGLIMGRFLTHKPDWLHMVVLARSRVELPEVARRRAHSQVLELTERELAFSAAEIKDYFDKTHQFTSPTGRVLMAIRENERRAECLGYDGRDAA